MMIIRQNAIHKILILLLISASINPITAQSDSAKIVHLYTQIWDGFAQKDFEPWYQAMSEDVEIISEAGRSLKGVMEVKDYYQPQLDVTEMKIYHWNITDIQVSCNLAVGQAEYQASFSEKGAQETKPVSFHWLFTWTKNKNDSWQLVRELYYQPKEN